MKRAFTLVEALVVACIVGIVLVLSIGAINGCGASVSPVSHYNSELSLRSVWIAGEGWIRYGNLNHNGHDFLLVHAGRGGTCAVHHPACACLKTAEKAE